MCTAPASNAPPLPTTGSKARKAAAAAAAAEPLASIREEDGQQKPQAAAQAPVEPQQQAAVAAGDGTQAVDTSGAELDEEQMRQQDAQWAKEYPIHPLAAVDPFAATAAVAGQMRINGGGGGDAGGMNPEAMAAVSEDPASAAMHERLQVARSAGNAVKVLIRMEGMHDPGEAYRLSA